MEKLIALSDLLAVDIDSLVKDKEGIAVQEKVYDDSRIYESLKRHYEYKSKRTIFNLPLVHINIGRGMYVAKGILAIGNVSIGLISIGLIALGGLCLGALALGLICAAGAALGLILSVGGLAVGTVAMGGLALGIFAVGGLAVGMFAMGGAAIASHVAVGGYASGHIAIGEVAKGVQTIVTQPDHFNEVTTNQVRTLINQEYPGLWGPVVDCLTIFFK